MPERDDRSLVEILEVSLAEPDPELLWGSSLDRPAADGRTDPEAAEGSTYSFEIEGWVVGRTPVSAVELVTQDDTCVWRIAPRMKREDVAAAYPEVAGAEESGFYAPVSALTMPSDFELQVRAALEGEAHADIGRIRGRRQPLQTGFEPRIRPLMMTTVGRTGSTVFFRMLERHPQILAYRPFLYETRVATYWIDVLRSLAEPSSYLRQLAPDANLSDRAWWLGTRTPLTRRILDREIQDWMGVAGVEALARFCQGRIEALYEQIAKHFERHDAVYFAERYVPTVIPSLMWELYPQAREVVLVRDFRDMVASIFAFDAKRGFYGFDRGPAESDDAYIERLGRRVSRRLLESWRQRSGRAHLVRYEDLVLRPDETLPALLEYLELDASQATIDAMRDSLSERTSETEQHRTTPDPEASIGRWREDLSPDLVSACERAFGEALEEFGYRSEGDPGR